MLSEIHFDLKNRRREITLCLGMGMALAGLSGSAHATLGGDGATVTADQAALHATMEATVGKDYTDYALTLPDDLTVHEFVNPSGHVFEVTWSGKGHRPDMHQLLGNYLTRFARREGNGIPTDRYSHRVDSDLVIHSSVHNRYFAGSAHLPGLFPDTMVSPVKVPVKVK